MVLERADRNKKSFCCIFAQIKYFICGVREMLVFPFLPRATHTWYVRFASDSVRELHISGMYTKTSVEGRFVVHTSGRKGAKGRCAGGMYKRIALQGRFCVHTRYVHPKQATKDLRACCTYQVCTLPKCTGGPRNSSGGCTYQVCAQLACTGPRNSKTGRKLFFVQ